MARHTTMRGEPIDMSVLVAQNSNKPALGNARMNARGDILGDDGIILKTQEQIEAEWEAEKNKQALVAGRKANLKSPLPDVIDPTTVTKKNLTDDVDFEPEELTEAPVQTAEKPRRRRIVDAE
jgi:hypothetical protein